MSKKQMVVLMGPSGCGKSTLETYAREELGIPVIISATTRSPRWYEKHGVHYYFCTQEEYDALDLAERNSYPSKDGEKWYGISKQEIADRFVQNSTILAVAEFKGVMQLKEVYPDELVIVFVTLPLDVMEQRMRDRNDSEENIQARLKQAIDKKEHEQGRVADYIIENYDLEESKRKLRQILGLEPVSAEAS